MSDKGARRQIIVNIDVTCDIVRFNRCKIIEMTRKVVRQFGIKKAQINFAVLDDSQIANLNRRFLKRTGITDVISFDLSDPLRRGRTAASKTDNLRIFDIAVNAEMAQRQAKSRGHKPQSELALYFLHGLLHNLGFDDSTAGKAAKMHKTEDGILKKFGYGVVYSQKK